MHRQNVKSTHMTHPGIPMNIKTKIAHVTCAILLLAGISSCARKPEEQPEVVKPAKIMKVGEDKDMLYSYFPGKVRALERAELAFEVAGRVIELPVKEGEEVTNKQVIARLDPRDFEAVLAAAVASLNQVKADYDSSKELFEKDIISKNEFLKSQRNYEVSQERVKTARKALEDSVLTAPFQGRVAKRYIDNFQNIQAKQQIASLQNLNVIEIVVDIPEQNIVNAGSNAASKAVAVFDATGNREFPVKVKEFSTQADPDTQTFRITFKMNAPKDVNILPGMSATVKIPMADPVKGGTLVFVPVGAVVPGADGNSYVWIVNPADMRVSRKKVTVGAMTGGSIAVLTGLQPDDSIVVSGVQDLRDGMKVRQFTVAEWK